MTDFQMTLRGFFDLIPCHLPEVTDLWIASWNATMPAIDFETRRAWFVDHMTRAMARGEVIRISVMQNGDVSGLVMIDPATGYLDQIFVGPLWWGAGVAEKLLDEARRVSPDKVRLTVNQDNPRALGFYARQGFATVGEGVNPGSGLKTFDLEWRAASG